MGKWTKESTGMEVFRPIAARLLINPELKARVWSENLESWGFFADGHATDTDMFILWCCSVAGDRVSFELGRNKDIEICTILAIWRDDNHNPPRWTMSLITPECKMVEISIEENKLFSTAWNNSGV